jgi:TRAP-type uncharacterized transport system substrate-binding protein
MDDHQKGANYKRCKVLWEISQYMSGDPEIKIGGNRDMCFTIGTGAGKDFTPSLRMATGAAALANAVVAGELEIAFVNPSALLTQAYRGIGAFEKPLPVRIIASFPSEDRFVFAIRESLGFNSLHDVKKARYPLRVSMREDPTHSAPVLIDQLLAAYGFSLRDLESWGGGLHPAGPPSDKRRIAGIRDGSVDAVADEGINGWLDEALTHGMKLLQFEDEVFELLSRLGWRRVSLGGNRFTKFDKNHQCIDFSGWPIYSAASLPDHVAYAVCNAFGARRDSIPWEDGSFQHVSQIGKETSASPRDVPLHPGAERWYREQGFID